MAKTAWLTPTDVVLLSNLWTRVIHSFNGGKPFITSYKKTVHGAMAQAEAQKNKGSNYELLMESGCWIKIKKKE